MVTWSNDSRVPTRWNMLRGGHCLSSKVYKYKGDRETT